MLQGLDMSASWICLLLISCAAGFPATKEDYKYPYLTISASGDEASPRSGALPQSESSRPPLPSLQHEPSAIQQPGAALQQPGSPAGIQSPSGPSAPPSRFVFPASSSNRPSRAPQSSGYVSPPVSFSGPSQPGAGSSNVGVNYAAYSPISSFGPSRLAAPSRFAQPASYGTPSRQAAPVSYEAPAPVSYATPVSQAAPVNFVAAPSSFSFEGFSSAPLSWPQLSAGFDGSFAPESWIPSRSFPDFSVLGSEEEVGAAPGFGGGKGAKGVQHEEVVEEIAPQASSSYITQSRNGYLRARELVSHMSYVPEEPEAPVIYYELVQRTQEAAPQAPAKGGKKF